MKTKRCFLFALIFLSTPLYSQSLVWNTWQQVVFGTSANLNFGYSDNTINKFYAVGDNGTFIYSSNSGANWTSINTGYTNSLKGFFLNGNSAFNLCGSNGLILKTNNAGLNFTVQNSGTNENLNSIAIFGNYPGICTGDNGTVLQTSNGGVNWSRVSLGVNSNLNFIGFSTNVKGIIVGDSGVIFKTNLEIPSLAFSFTRVLTGTTLNLKYALMLDSNNIWITASSGKILHTTNGGSNWQIINTGFVNDLHSISMPSASEMYVCGSNGLILISTDGGNKFARMNSNTTSDLNGIFIKNKIGVTIGSGGIVLRNLLGGTGGTFAKQQAQLDPAGASTFIWNTGVFNQDLRVNNTPGYVWPKGSAKTAIFSTGLCLAAYVNGELRMANASYNGEYIGGYIENGIAKTNNTFQIFRIKNGDNCSNSVDYANWQTMVPYGAPYVDVNSNGHYDACIDKPGMKNAAQTVFICLTDGFPQTHTTSEGFSGGTAPMNAEVHLTAWGYDSTYNINLSDALFFRWEIINKNNIPWNSFYSAIVSHSEVGNGEDDYIGCDSTRNLAYCYNADNMDGTGAGRSYGENPPAVGMRMLKPPIRKNAGVNDTLAMSSFCYYKGTGQPGPTCEQDPSSAPSLAFNYMKGIKKDGTPWLSPMTIPPYITKFCYTGDPETGAGWTEYRGKIDNCGGITTGNVVASPPDWKGYIMSFGKDNFTVNPGDTQVVIMTEITSRGFNNRNSVTKLKQLSDYAYDSFRSGGIPIEVNNIPVEIPTSFSLYQNYPNPFNPATTIKFSLPENIFTELKIFDVSGKLVTIIVSENLLPGNYEYKWDASALSSGIYFYELKTEKNSSTKKMILGK